MCNSHNGSEYSQLCSRLGKRLLKPIQWVLSTQLASNAAVYAGSAALGGFFMGFSWPITLLSMAYFIDNPWTVASRRASTAGKLLADILAARLHGRRPVTLVGYSIGARVIFKCLETLARMGPDRGHGIVETAVLLGAPVMPSPRQWAAVSSVCAHRLVNCYSETDWVLGFVYRASSTPHSVAGLGPAPIDEVENVDVGGLVQDHTQYKSELEGILVRLGVADDKRTPFPPRADPNERPLNDILDEIQETVSVTVTETLQSIVPDSDDEDDNQAGNKEQPQPDDDGDEGKGLTQPKAEAEGRSSWRRFFEDTSHDDAMHFELSPPQLELYEIDPTPQEFTLKEAIAWLHSAQLATVDVLDGDGVADQVDLGMEEPQQPNAAIGIQCL